MVDDLNEELMKADNLALRRFRKDVDNSGKRRRLELEDLLAMEERKPESERDADKLRWLRDELKALGGEEGD